MHSPEFDSEGPEPWTSECVVDDKRSAAGPRRRRAFCCAGLTAEQALERGRPSLRFHEIRNTAFTNMLTRRMLTALQMIFGKAISSTFMQLSSARPKGMQLRELSLSVPHCERRLSRGGPLRSTWRLPARALCHPLRRARDQHEESGQRCAGQGPLEYRFHYRRL